MPSAPPDPASSGRRPEACSALDALDALHDEIDREVARLSDLHRGRLRCGRGCASCCLLELRVSPVEAERIRRAYPDLLREGEPHAEGGCAFLDRAGACRIYDARPFVCRTQGLPLRVFLERDSGGEEGEDPANDATEIEEHRSICELNVAGGPPIEDLPEAACWLVGPYELRLARIDEAFREESAAEPGSSEADGVDADAGSQRIALRSLFRTARGTRARAGRDAVS